ncbi:hypothetical protein [Cronobacter sakazakii]|uniref:hypothetical protein n=1 Tax=Cronobacter sakazakii TaxID=28141 RepID=UPI001319FD8D|nr:hypothetical protein [Cronobacter sakazakii]
MDNLENFPCYDHSVLTDFSFQTIQPVSVTLPYDKASYLKYILDPAYKNVKEGKIIPYQNAKLTKHSDTV